MSKIEKKVLDFVTNNIAYFMLGLAILAGLVIRFSLRGIVSDDMGTDYLVWADAYSKMTLWEALGTPLGNYSALYQLMLFILARIPVLSVVSRIKFVSCLFDFLIAGLAFYIGKKEFKSVWKAVLLFSLVFLCPIVFLNSAAWGQCDSIFGFFLLLSMYLLMKDRPIPAFIFLGISFSWKLQAVLLIPFFIIKYLKDKKFSILCFLIIPAVMLFLNIPFIMAGRPVASIFGTYSSQVSIYPESIYINFSNIYALFVADLNAGALGGFASYGAVLLAVCALGILAVIIIRKKKPVSLQDDLYIGFLLAFTAVMFLPKMHDRYGYVYEILALVLCVTNRKTIVPCILLLAQSLFHYGLCLTGFQAMPLWVATFLYIGAYVWYLAIYFKKDTVFPNIDVKDKDGKLLC